jgi:glycosyltransferase involved in cell wall biosynthesis
MLPETFDVSDRGTGRTGAAVRLPAVAAIVCNFNQGAYVEAAIASVAAQTYPCLECIVVDDCSADGSGEAIASLLAAQGAPRFQLIRHPENRGQMAAMLSGFDATNAPFVAWLDADDVWLPEYVERHMAHHFNAQVNAAISTSNMAVIDAEGTLIAGAAPPMSVRSPLRGKSDRSFPIRPARLLHHGKEIDFDLQELQGPLFINRQYEAWVWSSTSGMVFRRAAVEAVRPLRCEGLRTCADHYLARFAHVVGGTIWIGETLGCYRIHGGNGLAKRAVHGDGPLGKEPSHIAEEGNYQFAMKLKESDLLAALMADGDLNGLLVRIGRGRLALWTILSSAKLRRAMRLGGRLRLLRRWLAALPTRR